MTRVRLTNICLSLGVAVLLTACPSSYYSQVPEPFISNHENQIADSEHYQTKLQDLVNKQFANNAKVKVVVNHFNVLVVGQVANQDTQVKLDAFIKNQTDTRTFWDYADIAATPSLKENSRLAKKVTERLASEQDLNLDDISVTVVDGTAYILGTNFGDITHLTYAIRGVYAIEGIKGVVNLAKPGSGDFVSGK